MGSTEKHKFLASNLKYLASSIKSYCSECGLTDEDSIHTEKGADDWNPPKYPLGIDTVELTRHMTFNVGSVVKYLFRPHYKGKEVEDLKKARFYLDDEIKRLEFLSNESKHV